MHLNGHSCQDVIESFLKEWAGTPAVWGKTDCGMRVADYVLAQTGKDPAAEMRGQYSNFDECVDMILGRWGSILEMARYGFESVGLRPTNHPQNGDVGVVQVGFAIEGKGTKGRGQVIALKCSGPLWACPLLDYGSKFLSVPNHKVLGAWSVLGAGVDADTLQPSIRMGGV